MSFLRMRGGVFAVRLLGDPLLVPDRPLPLGFFAMNTLDICYVRSHAFDYGHRRMRFDGGFGDFFINPAQDLVIISSFLGTSGVFQCVFAFGDIS